MITILSRRMRRAREAARPVTRAARADWPFIARQVLLTALSLYAARAAKVPGDVVREALFWSCSGIALTGLVSEFSLRRSAVFASRACVILAVALAVAAVFATGHPQVRP